MDLLPAYLDPGSGSLVLQVLLGGVAALGVGIKLWWRRFVSMFSFRRRDADQTDR